MNDSVDPAKATLDTQSERWIISHHVFAAAVTELAVTP